MLARFPNVRRWEDTDDLVQNAVLRLHRALAEIRPDSPRSTIALAAKQLHWELIDLARRHIGPLSFAANHATNAPGKPGDELSPGDTPAAEFEAALAAEESLDRWTVVRKAIADLPGELREVFDLVWYLNADQKTIARLLECSERTVKTRWREARESVRVAVDGETPR